MCVKVVAKLSKRRGECGVGDRRGGAQAGVAQTVADDFVVGRSVLGHVAILGERNGGAPREIVQQAGRVRRLTEIAASVMMADCEARQVSRWSLGPISDGVHDELHRVIRCECTRSTGCVFATLRHIGVPDHACVKWDLAARWLAVGVHASCQDYWSIAVGHAACISPVDHANAQTLSGSSVSANRGCSTTFCTLLCASPP